MRSRISALIAAVLGLTVVLGGCSAPAREGTYFGPTQMLGDGTVRTYVVLDADGAPAEVGLRVAAAAMDGLPDQDVASHGAHDGHGEGGVLILPPEASDTVFDHAMVNWNVRGHEPMELFGDPHFDFHFYMDDPGAVTAIDPSSPTYAAEAAALPPERYLPRDFTPPPGEPAASAVPAMGLHWTDESHDLTPGTYDFDQIFINGSWDGRYTFMEPMITRDFLMSRAGVDEEIKQPEAYQHTGYYPTRYVVRFDKATQEHVITLSGMIMRQRT